MGRVDQRLNIEVFKNTYEEDSVYSCIKIFVCSTSKIKVEQLGRHKWLTVTEAAGEHNFGTLDKYYFTYLEDRNMLIYIDARIDSWGDGTHQEIIDNGIESRPDLVEKINKLESEMFTN